MSKTKIREMICYALGGITVIIPIAGSYPLGISFFVAGALQYLNRVVLFIISAISMLLFLEPLVAVKYLCILVISTALISMIENLDNTCNMTLGAIICSGATMVVNIAGIMLLPAYEKYMFSSVVESIIVFSSAMIFGKMVHSIIRVNDVGISDIGTEKRRDIKRIHECADSFVKLAKTFKNLPMYKECFTDDDLNYMCIEMADGYCAGCGKMSLCWDRDYYETARDTAEIFKNVINNNEIDNNLALSHKCINYPDYIEQITRVFEKTKLNNSWYNRILENREAIILQLNAAAEIMEECTYEKKDITDLMWMKVKRIKNILSAKFLQVNRLRILQNKNGYIEIELRVFSKIKRCVTVKEIANDISKIYGKRLTGQYEDRKIVGNEEVELVFSEDTKYFVLTGVERRTKDGEQSSGDNFSLINQIQGEFIMSLSDGMGSGIKACKESETVIELIEKFLEAGFSKSTALRMINSAMVLEDGQGLYSTIDIASLDLYSGNCEFYKIGAAPTYIKREDCIEVIQSTSLPAGIFHKIDIERSAKRVYDNEFIIMLSDGMLDYIPDNNENTMVDILLSIDSNNPKEIARCVMEKVLKYNDMKVYDDMTIMVCGVFGKTR